MTTLTRTMPIWPGLDMSRKTKDMAVASRRKSSEMVTVKAAKIIQERSIKAKVPR